MMIVIEDYNNLVEDLNYFNDIIMVYVHITLNINILNCKFLLVHLFVHLIFRKLDKYLKMIIK